LELAEIIPSSPEEEISGNRGESDPSDPDNLIDSKEMGVGFVKTSI
jgi:hypothetical protein